MPERGSTGEHSTGLRALGGPGAVSRRPRSVALGTAPLLETRLFKQWLSRSSRLTDQRVIAGTGYRTALCSQPTSSQIVGPPEKPQERRRG